MFRKMLVAGLVVTAAIVMVPSIASATSVPALPGGVHQAYIADVNGDPQNGSLTITGPLTTTGAFSMSCTNHDEVVDYFDDGTAAVSSYSVTGCTVAGFPSCPITITPTGLPWGASFGHDTSSGTYKLYVNVSLDFTLGAAAPACPAFGTIPETGTLSPTVSITSPTLSMAFAGSTSGTLSGPLGSMDWSGTITGAVPSGSQFVF